MEIAKVVSRLGDSKTYVLLIFLALLGLVACIIASAFFGEHYWGKFFDQLLGESVTGGVRAAAVDGAPKIAAAWRDPNSQAANPPSAMLATSGANNSVNIPPPNLPPTQPSATLAPFVPPGG